MSKTVVVAWGRMNPPTIGHEQVYQRVQQISKQYNGTPRVYVSQSQDKKKNPLTYKQKIDYLRKGMPNGNITQHAPKVKTIIDMAQDLDDEFDQLVVVAGSDRMDEYDKLLSKYNGKDFSFEDIKVVSAGARDPDASGAKGMSASKLRELAVNNNFKEFKKGAPSGLKKDAVEQLYRDVREAMGVVEESVKEAEMTDELERKREEYVKELKKRKDEFKDRYGDDWESVMYATATKMAKDDLGINERWKPDLRKLLLANDDSSNGSEAGSSPDSGSSANNVDGREKYGERNKPKGKTKTKSGVIVNPDTSDEEYHRTTNTDI